MKEKNSKSAEILHNRYGLSLSTCRALVNRFGHETEPKDWTDLYKVLCTEGIGKSGFDSVERLLSNLGIKSLPLGTLDPDITKDIQMDEMLWVWKGNPKIKPSGPFRVLSVSASWVKLEGAKAALQKHVFRGEIQALLSMRRYFQERVRRIDKRIAELSEKTQN